MDEGGGKSGGGSGRQSAVIWQLAALWEAIADAIPGETALINGRSRRDWGLIEQRAAALAGGLVDRGIRPDAKVAIYALNSIEHLEAYFATFKARARSEEHTSELQSLMRISYAVFCLKNTQ